MDLKIVSIKNTGDYTKEVVKLKVLDDCDIGIYLLSDSTYTSEGKLSNKIRHIYWFPDEKVSKGDFVWLYTRPKKSGDEDKWSNKSKSTTYAFYWGLKTAVWNDEGDFAVLIQANNWEYKKVSAAKK